MKIEVIVGLMMVGALLGVMLWIISDVMKSKK